MAAAKLGNDQEAISHYKQALRINADSYEAYNNLSNALSRIGCTREAIEHIRQAIHLRPDEPNVNRRLAWLLATQEIAEGGDGEEAIRLAERACALINRKDVAYLDTLAAAYAAAGRFDEAVITAKEVWQLARAAGQGALAEEFHMRLQLYRDRKPYREPTVNPAKSLGLERQ